MCPNLSAAAAKTCRILECKATTTFERLYLPKTRRETAALPVNMDQASHRRKKERHHISPLLVHWRRRRQRRHAHTLGRFIGYISRATHLTNIFMGINYFNFVLCPCLSVPASGPTPMKRPSVATLTSSSSSVHCPLDVLCVFARTSAGSLPGEVRAGRRAWGPPGVMEEQEDPETPQTGLLSTDGPETRY